MRIMKNILLLLLALVRAVIQTDLTPLNPLFVCPFVCPAKSQLGPKGPSPPQELERRGLNFLVKYIMHLEDVIYNNLWTSLIFPSVNAQ